MSKKYILIVILLLIIFISGCTVDSNTGLVTITNLTLDDISNIKIGNTYLVNYLRRGATYDYWYFAPLSGSLTGSSVVQVALYTSDESAPQTRNNPDCTFKLGYEYKIEIIEKDNKNWFYIHRGYKVGSSYDSDNKYHDPTD